MDDENIVFPTIPKHLQEINDMKQNFYRLLDKMWTSLKDSDIQDTIGRLGEANCVSRRELTKIQQISSIEQLRIHLGVTYWSYLDIDNLVPIITAEDVNADIKKDFEVYRDKLELLKERTVSEFPHGFFQQATAIADTGEVKVSLEIHNPTFRYIIMCVKMKLAEILDCRPNKLILYELTYGSIQITFLMKKSVAVEVFEKQPLSPKQIEALRAEHITSLQYESSILFSIDGKAECSAAPYGLLGKLAQEPLKA